ncbi:uncharacterized protein LOC100826562 isoform X2 [Brachypodium distachyon]|uniref:uncharacterized protein LOC100826562 isoform X2 n=1 Tax=Brachypodium distachyon TaxID=15368 RepID=UPI0006E49389|nr:uncharacterized protein LOC100826562 isoform X2 [Brachypodium distachyon]|eukprot:XP_014756225.1 uncharacterized protein LOC100826562 isoform X2 [Brachypodium distachyon]
MGRDPPIVLSSDSEEGEPVEVEDVKGKVKEVEEDFKEPPKWLPDGWIMEVQRGEDGSFYQYYISPVSGVKLRMKAEVLSYLFSGMDDRFLESKKCAARNTLHSTHLWLPKGWFIEIRAGGENMDKMFKFYIYPPMEIRLFSKEDVLLYVKEMVVSACDTEGQCDTSSQDNILALVEFNPSVLLPEGWVKEIVYRKTKEGIRKDPNEFLRKRLTNKTGNNDQTSDRFEDGESSTDFGSPKDHQESMNKSKKIKEKEPNSDKIIKRSRKKSSRGAKAKQIN